jgi:uncharacterized membrane protein YgcG
VVIFSSWPSDLVLEDYAQELFQAVKLGQKGKDNGVLVLVSIETPRSGFRQAEDSKGFCRMSSVLG